MLNSLIDIVREVRVNIADKRTTVKGVILFALGLFVLIVPFMPFAIVLEVEQYAQVIEYARLVGFALCIGGLILIGAIRSKDNEAK